jgi:hypothetical protein
MQQTSEDDYQANSKDKNHGLPTYEGDAAHSLGGAGEEQAGEEKGTQAPPSPAARTPLPLQSARHS